ncbi:glycosyl hydrolase family 18 protein [Cellulosimicrobium arenosum]|uniref:chitinase n=1 Tax=Cellulosimicrobium arenosum TaxID=2708133 RepID=A0A927PDC7_9MICO|nr:glycosyl hydrolase family 18 protein [Cellulosimicrobium arenosum]MBD8079683.1 chitinase [Cellulosimicrobium arenosum]
MSDRSPTRPVPPSTAPGARRRLAGAVGATASTALLLGALAAPAVAAPADPPHGAADLNGYRSVGYVMADSRVTRDFQIADLVRTGAIEDLTHINYAFGNVTADLVCDIADVPGEGDPENDYLAEVSAADSVDGTADVPGQALAGNFNQLRELKDVSPGTKVLVSLGGWTWSDHFSEAASTPEGRTALVDSCIDLYIDGNLPEVGGRGGPGAAAGIFDGIDIDWEWPVTGGETANARPEDKENFLLLMEEFRSALDAAGAATGEDYLLTAFAPAGGWNAGEGGWLDPRLFDVVDFLNVQGYDFHGGWVPNQTGHQGNLHPDGDNNWGLGLDGALGMYVDAGADPSQINAGLAAYGHGWFGVEDGSQAWQPAQGYVGTKTYAELQALDGESFFDPELGASWLYDGDEWWSYDDPTSVTAKAEFVATQGYGGAMWWDLSGDHRNELGDALGSTLRAATPGPGVAAECAVPWYGSGVYTGGDVVSHGGTEYAAQWWTRNQVPGSSSAWQQIGPCGTAPDVEVQPCASEWSREAVYTGGQTVTRAGVNYTAQWWTRGELPGSTPWGSWDPVGLCA